MRRRIIQQKSVFFKAGLSRPKKKRYFFNEAAIYRTKRCKLHGRINPPKRLLAIPLNAKGDKNRDKHDKIHLYYRRRYIKPGQGYRFGVHRQDHGITRL